MKEVVMIFWTCAAILSMWMTYHMVNRRGCGRLKKDGQDVTTADFFQDYVLNFLGCILGWVAVYYIFFYRIGVKVELTDLIIVLFAYVGVTGYLPHLIINKGLKP